MSLTTGLRVLQVLVVLMICPMVALGVMSSLSGGGVTPAYQEIGRRFITLSLFVPIPLLLLSEVVHRWLKLTPLALVLLLVPLVMWGGMLVQLQRETQFFTW